MNFLVISGWVISALGLGYAFYQTHRVKRINRRNREQVLMFLSRANFVSNEHKLVDEINKRLDDRILQRYVSGLHQAGCDLYLFLVDYYLSLEEKFSADDLRRICNTPLIATEWQERHWRAMIALRPENRDKSLPEGLFTTKDRQSRYRYYQLHSGNLATTAGSENSKSRDSEGIATGSNPRQDLQRDS